MSSAHLCLRGAARCIAFACVIGCCVAAGSACAAEEPRPPSTQPLSTQPLRIRRVYVPAEKPERWPAGDWVPMNLQEFERLLAAAARDPLEVPRCASLEATASLAGRIARLPRGSHAQAPSARPPNEHDSTEPRKTFFFAVGAAGAPHRSGSEHDLAALAGEHGGLHCRDGSGGSRRPRHSGRGRDACNGAGGGWGTPAQYTDARP